jgi:hypothetical protein
VFCREANVIEVAAIIVAVPVDKLWISGGRQDQSAGDNVADANRMLPIRSESRHSAVAAVDLRRKRRRLHATGAPADVVERPFLYGRG